MSATHFISLCFFILSGGPLFAQNEFIYTKEGYEILRSRQLIASCLTGLHKDKSDAKALAICECQIYKLDRKFTKKQYKNHTKNHIIDIESLIKEDSLIEKEINACFGKSGQTVLLQAESFETEFIAGCIKSIQNNTEKKIDSNRLQSFCSCQLNMVKSKKISDAEMETLSNPNSLLFFEMMYNCGDPFLEKPDIDRNWSLQSANDITGPASDTIKILNMQGMTYLKIKTGSLIQVWLFDTGASDLLITKDMETALKKENFITEQNYLGTGEYEMANGIIDTCRKYKINSIGLGRFVIDNVVIAVSDKARRIIVGKGLLNKFSNWSLNNRDKILILSK